MISSPAAVLDYCRRDILIKKGFIEMAENHKYAINFEELSNDDVSRVGGKNASLGEMLSRLSGKGVRIPKGFATTSGAYWNFLEKNELKNKIKDILSSYESDDIPLEKAGKKIRRLILNSSFPEDIEDKIIDAYKDLCKEYDDEETDVAVRSSGTAEDLPEASFAGQQETYLNISGKDELMEACKKCYSSLFTNRAISYRNEKGFDHMKVALSIGVQKMVRSDKAGSGVMFTLDTDSGFKDAILINAAWGIGENVVQGNVTPDEYMVFKPLINKEDFKPIVEKKVGKKEKKMIYAKDSKDTVKNIESSSKEQRSFVLKDEEIIELSKWALAIEDHYEKPMDIEWAKDGELDKMFIVQARPETVQSQKEKSNIKSYTLKESSEVITKGAAIGEAISADKACILEDADMINEFEEGSILVTGRTDPDWVPIMKKASGVITEYGGRTSHAAIVSRELGIPAIVGTGDATDRISDGQEITLSCAEGSQGKVYDGKLGIKTEEIDLEKLPKINTDIMINIATPEAAFHWWKLPVKGIGLARMEFIINNAIKIHPMALVEYENIDNKKLREKISDLTKNYDNKEMYFIDNLSLGIAKIAASQYPEDVIVRMSDFKSNEYKDLIGGEIFEDDESNPMLGFRGASRYYSDDYKEAFHLECKAIKKVREEKGLKNVKIMIPFCRTVEEADKVLKILKEAGLQRGKDDLDIYVMAEIPSNIFLADDFAEKFDGFSIGSNDLTQLVLGVDRDSEKLKEIFDERNTAVKEAISKLIEISHEHDTKVGICGQAPSDYPEFTEFLVKANIDSISLDPHSVIKMIKTIAKLEEN